MSFAESEEHAMLRAAVRQIGEAHGGRSFLDASKDGNASALWSTLASHGFVGVNVPEEYGGGGRGITELAIVCEELAAQGCPLLWLLITPAICASILSRHGSDQQRRHWLPQIASGEARMSFAITEPDAGSNSHRLATSARRDGDAYVLRGTKTFISGVDEAAAILVVARTGERVDGRAPLSLLIVDADAPGLQRTVIPVEMSAPERQFTLFFDDVRVAGDALIGTEGDGMRQVFSGLNPERITAAAISNGIGRYALDRAAAYARDRTVWDTPIGAHQGLAHPLAQAKIAVELARLMTAKAAWFYDAGLDAGEAANMAKYAAAEASLVALDQAIQTHGGNGMTTEFGLAPLWGVARLLKTAPVSREMILNYVAQHSLGLPRSY